MIISEQTTKKKKGVPQGGGKGGGKKGGGKGGWMLAFESDRMNAPFLTKLIPKRFKGRKGEGGRGVVSPLCRA